MLHSLLNEREARWHRKTQLAQEYASPVLTLLLNIPGPDKNLLGTEEVFAQLQQALRCQLGIACSAAGYKAIPCVLYEESGCGVDGPYWHLVISMSALELKCSAVLVEENHPLGRLADADVINSDGEMLSRRQLGLSSRRCFLCGKEAAVCRRSATHSLEELIAAVKEMLVV